LERHRGKALQQTRGSIPKNSVTISVEPFRVIAFCCDTAAGIVTSNFEQTQFWATIDSKGQNAF
jgi:hypothetical protein